MSFGVDASLCLFSLAISWIGSDNGPDGRTKGKD